MIISISGLAGSGKDTLAYMLTEVIKRSGMLTDRDRVEVLESVEYKTQLLPFEKNDLFRIFKFARPAKTIVAELLNISELALEDQKYKNQKLENGTVRDLIGAVANSVRSVAGDDFWTKHIMDQIKKEFEAPINPIIYAIVTDTRFDNELRALKRNAALLIKVERPYKKEELATLPKGGGDLVNRTKDFDVIVQKKSNLEDLLEEACKIYDTYIALPF